MKRKRILYTAIKYPYAKLNLGLSYEYYNFYDSLNQLEDFEVKEFDWVTLEKKIGREKMNRLLLEVVKKYNPDLVFFSIFKEEFDKDTIRKISRKTLTINWFCDDLWRFDNYVKDWVFCFNWITTVTENLVNRYKSIGFNKVIFSQFASNPRIYKKLSLSKKLDISFIGETHSNRKRLVKEIIKRGIDINTWGKGWKNGTVEFKNMLQVFNQTKINLNFTDTSFSFPYGRFLPWFAQPKFIEENKSKVINGRLFEILSCGGFILTGDAPNLQRYFKIGEEIEVYYNFEDLVEKIQYYLKNDSKRKKIAMAGYKRVLKDHTYKKRFLDIFKKIGLVSNQK